MLPEKSSSLLLPQWELMGTNGKYDEHVAMNQYLLIPFLGG